MVGSAPAAFCFRGVEVNRMAVPFPTSHVAALLARWPAPWHVRRRRNLPVTCSELVEIHDADGKHVMDVVSSTLGDGLVSLVNSAYAVGAELPPETVEPIVELPAPWRGQLVEREGGSASRFRLARLHRGDAMKFAARGVSRSNRGRSRAPRERARSAGVR